MEEYGPLFARFDREIPSHIEIKNTSRGESDFRETLLARWENGEKLVLKLACNDFTTAHRLTIWQRCAEAYRQLGYYCPTILPDAEGRFPTVPYKGRSCLLWGETFSPYASAESFPEESITKNGFYTYCEDMLTMTAQVAAARFDFCDFPSGYCLFETFCPSDPVDEVLENALEWQKTAAALPEDFQPQVQRIWTRWEKNRQELKKLYPRLPRSVFQADTNPTNVLLDESRRFRGVYDFNLCGRDTLLNYLFREVPCVMAPRAFGEDYKTDCILRALKTVSAHYAFCPEEKQAALLLYRCLLPLWFSETERLKEAGADREKIRQCLDQTEYMQTREIDFASAMERK